MVGLFSQHSVSYISMATSTQQQAAKIANIIVVDDEVSIAHMIADILTDEGYGVEVYHDGASALQAVLARPPELILLDIAMPIMTGEEVLTRLRQSGFPELPIIMMSAGPRLAHCIEQGASATIAKPFELPELLKCVAQYYRKERAVNQPRTPRKR